MEDAAADLVVANLVLEHIADLAPVFAEAARTDAGAVVIAFHADLSVQFPEGDPERELTRWLVETVAREGLAAIDRRRATTGDARRVTEVNDAIASEPRAGRSGRPVRGLA